MTCWGRGTPLREFLHVDDLGDASVFALESWKPRLGDLSFMNVGTGTDLPIHQLAQQVANASGFQGEIHWDSSKEDGTPKKVLDVTRMASLGWKAKISLTEGLLNTIDLFRENYRIRNIRQ